jgi:UDP-N-acetylmuramate dehydrogenase
MLINNESMAKHCSFRSGGIARKFFVPDSIKSLSEFLRENTLPVLMLGLGSNILVRDTGFNGVVIKVLQLKNLCREGIFVIADAGLTLSKLSRYCDKQKLNGAEFLSAIPGTVGGALAMNAGAFGSEFWNYVESVTTINKDGQLLERTKKDFDVGYRYVKHHHPGEYFVSAKLILPEKINSQNIKELLLERNKLQPIGKPSCGSVFKNPKDNFAASMIDKCNLKGFCIGGACVSDKHANFIINTGDASASDIENLIKHIQDSVHQQFSITLETEVKII